MVVINKLKIVQIISVRQGTLTPNKIKVNHTINNFQAHYLYHLYIVHLVFFCAQTSARLSGPLCLSILFHFQPFYASSICLCMSLLPYNKVDSISFIHKNIVIVTWHNFPHPWKKGSDAKPDYSLIVRHIAPVWGTCALCLRVKPLLVSPNFIMFSFHPCNPVMDLLWS